MFSQLPSIDEENSTSDTHPTTNTNTDTPARTPWSTIKHLLTLFPLTILSIATILLFLQLQALTLRVTTQQHQIDDLSHQLSTSTHEISQQVEKQHDFTILHIAGTFTLLSCMITMFHMTAHLRNMYQPFVQRKVLAILWMSPIYGVTSFLSLVWVGAEGYLGIVKDFYESYVIYTFLSFLIAVIGRGEGVDGVGVSGSARASAGSGGGDGIDNRIGVAGGNPADGRENDRQPSESSLDYQSNDHYIDQDQDQDPQPHQPQNQQHHQQQNQQQHPHEYHDLIGPQTLHDRQAVVTALSHHATHLKPPYRCLSCLYHPPPHESDMALANAVLLECQVLAMQFVFFRPLTAIANFVLELVDDDDGGGGSGSGGKDEDGSVWSFVLSPKFIILMVQNVSVFFAFAGLLKFYHAVRDELAWCQPFAKFLTIKGVVFMTFWQSLAISIIFHTFKSDDSNSNDDDETSSSSTQSAVSSASGIQHVLICMEMLFFSVAHWCVFPAEEWEPGYKARFYDGPGFGFKDFASDVSLIIDSGKKSMKARRDKKRGFGVGGSGVGGGGGLDHLGDGSSIATTSEISSGISTGARSSFGSMDESRCEEDGDGKPHLI